MAINVRQWPTLEIVGYPNFSANGAVTFTFNAAATQAQVDADASLFNNWATLAAEAAVRNGPVTVIFESNCTITGTNTFPQGSRFVGVASVFPQITSGAGVVTRNIQHFQSVELVCSPGGPTSSFGSPTFSQFRDVVFNVTNPGTVIGLGASGGFSLDHCFGPGGTDIGAGSPGPVVFFFSGANEYFIDLSNGTTLAPPAIATDAAAGGLGVIINPSATASGFFPNIDAAWGGLGSEVGAGEILPNANLDTVTGINAAAQWPAAPNPNLESNTSLLYLSAATSGHNVSIGNPGGGQCGFSQGQILRVINTTPGAAHTLTLLQPNNATNILIGAGTNAVVEGDTAAAGGLRGVTLQCIRPFDPGKAWECINTFIVPA